MPEISTRCKRCGTVFAYAREVGQRGRYREFCSATCANLFGGRSNAVVACATCSKAFRPRLQGQTYCCLSCRPPSHKKWASKAEGAAVYWARRKLWVTGAAFERFTRTEIFERDGWNCGICGDPVERGPDASRYLRPSIDHVVALSRGGSHTKANVQCSHWICNSRKSAMLPTALFTK